MIGQRLGPYEITAKLGAGGMGEVYRAHDTKLDREVAIKVLPAHLAADADALARFEREAKAVAALSHPNILAIFDFGHVGDTAFAAMELLQGQTLRERLAAGALPTRKALEVGAQVALGLAAAHQRGIVHRDLKPDNLFLTTDGQVKILDFGLARRDEIHDSHSQLLAAPTKGPGTAPGAVLGTVGYMSPEQVRGEPADHRSDIFSLGVALFEMLTGRRAFDRGSAVETMSAILREEPPELEALGEKMSPSLVRLPQHCLEKRPEDRFQSARDLAFDLQSMASGNPASAPSGRAVALAGRRGAWRPWLMGFAGGAAALALGALALRSLTPASPPELYRFAISAASGASISGGAGNSAISPDGRRVVFVGDADARQGLWIQELSEIRARLLPGTEGATFPFWAPDSRRIAYFAEGKLNQVSLLNGRVEELCAAPDGRGGSWGRAGTIVFAPAVTGGLAAVAEAGGTARSVTRIEAPAEESSHRFPSFLPDGKRFVYIADPGANTAEGRVYVASIDGGERRLLYGSRRAPVYAAPGFLIDAIDERLVARRFDPRTAELSGEPVRLQEATPSYVRTQDRVASVSDSGALLVPSAEGQWTRLVWLDRRGRRVGEVPLPKGRFELPKLSPDGRRLAMIARGDKLDEADVWVVDLVTEQASRLTFRPGIEEYPIWSPDGKNLVFQADPRGPKDLFVRPATGAGAERVLFESPIFWKVATSWVGATLSFQTTEAETGFDVWLMRPERPTEPPVHLLSSPATEGEAAISPDGNWLAYESNASGRYEIYVVSLPDAKIKYQVTTEGAQYPMWTQGGRELVYTSLAHSVAVVPVTLGDTLAFGTPVTLFPRPRSNWGASGEASGLDVSADGSRFVVLEPESKGSQTLVVVTNWLAELGGEGAEN